MAKLTAVTVRTKAEKGRYADGGGLYLQVRDADRKSWLFRYTVSGKAREMGLGPATGPSAISLANAREAAQAAQRLIQSGMDPLQAKAAAKVARATEGEQTLRGLAGEYIATHSATWRNDKHAAQWSSTLKTYAYPVIGDCPIKDVDRAAVLRVLEPIWMRMPVTASRLRGRIESVMDLAIARGHYARENPARWLLLKPDLAAPKKIKPVRHQSSLPYSQVGEFMKALDDVGGIAAHCLRFLILTASRSGEALGARWGEIDMAKAVWSIPATRMKAGKAHTVPLPPAALTLLAELRPSAPAADAPVFPSPRNAKNPLSSMALEMLLRRMNPADEGGVYRWRDTDRRPITAHGFRSSFRVWAGEEPVAPPKDGEEPVYFAREVAEAALAHTLQGVEASYQRSTLLDRRRPLMNAWAEWCAKPRPAGEVVQLPVAPAGNVVALRAAS